MEENNIIKIDFCYSRRIYSHLYLYVSKIPVSSLIFLSQLFICHVVRHVTKVQNALSFDDVVRKSLIVADVNCLRWSAASSAVDCLRQPLFTLLLVAVVVDSVGKLWSFLRMRSVRKQFFESCSPSPRSSHVLRDVLIGDTHVARFKFCNLSPSTTNSRCCFVCRPANCSTKLLLILGRKK